MNRRPLVALDLGSTKVACAVGLAYEHAPGFEVLGSSLVPYPVLSDGWLSDPLMVGRVIEQALEGIAVPVDVDRAIVGVSPPSTMSHVVRASVDLADEPVSVRSRDLERLQANALVQVLGVDREALLVERIGCDGNGFSGVRDPRGLPATRLVGQFLILTVPMACRRAVVQAVESAGLEVARLTSTVRAAMTNASDISSAGQRVAFIDAGALTTTLALFVDGTLQAADIMPSGGLTLATSIAATLQATMDQAITWSLQGMTCRKAEVRSLIEQQRARLEQRLTALLADQPRPDAVLLAGRAALMDGYVEWVERTTHLPTSWCRNPRTSTVQDLSRQVGLSPAIGLLELAARSSDGHPAPRATHPLNRLVDRTRAILTEYF